MVNLHDEVLQLLHKSCTSGTLASLVKFDIVQIFQYIGLFKTRLTRGKVGASSCIFSNLQKSVSYWLARVVPISYIMLIREWAIPARPGQPVEKMEQAPASSPSLLGMQWNSLCKDSPPYMARIFYHLWNVQFGI